MSFAENFREKYRAALCAARANNKDATILGLTNLYKLFEEQYSLNNGDSIITKVKLSYWKDVFSGYIDIIRENGLQDKRVQKLFGLVDDKNIPSLGDFMSGKGDAGIIEPPRVPSEGGIDIDGLTPENPSKDSKKAEIPVMPETPELPTPIAPIEPVMESGNGKNDPSFSPDTLEGFIGQQHIVKVLLKEIAIAKAQGRKYLDNILLLGNPGLGKTTLMQLIAKELGVEFEWMDCSQYHSSQQSLKAMQNFLTKVARENEPVVIAFDEIHMLSEALQSSLLTLLQSRVFVSPPDRNGVVKRIPIENFTFIAATTDDDKLLNTIKDRCLRLKFQMVDYTPEELKRIYKNKVASKGLSITDDAIEACIPRSRGSIRYVNAFVEGLNTTLYNDEGQLTSLVIDTETVKKYFADRGIDAIGLEKKDVEVLRAIEENATPMGSETLASRVGLEVKKYLSEYEPYLVKIGFISVTPRGRVLTEKAKNYLKGV